MPTLALALVLAAAVCHAGWNIALKKAHGNGLSFFALVGIVEILVWALPVWWLLPDLSHVDGKWPIAMLGSAVVHIAYFWLLLRAYKSSDLSLAYPLARATGPLLSVLAAIFFLGETPTATALVGELLIICGSIWIGVSCLNASAFGPSKPKGFYFTLPCSNNTAN